MLAIHAPFDERFREAYLTEGRSERLLELRRRQKLAQSNAERRLWGFLRDSYKSLLVGKPDVLQDLCDRYDQIVDRLPPNRSAPIAKDVLAVFDYEQVKRRSRLGTHDIIRQLPFRVCPYCCRNYAHLVQRGEGEAEARPHIDHWFPHARYPLAAVSLYNLVPACSLCNSSLKRDLIFRVEQHFHPYVDRPIAFAFRYDRLVAGVAYQDGIVRIDVDKSDRLRARKAERHLRVFFLQDAYQACAPAGRDLTRLMVTLADQYRQMRLGALGLGRYRSYFESITAHLVQGHLGDTDRPLGKFRRDIYNQMRGMPRFNLPPIT